LILRERPENNLCNKLKHQPMIKNLLPLFFLILSIISNAQSYIPLLDSVNIWSYTNNSSPMSPPPHFNTMQDCSYPNYGHQHYYTSNDTTINSLTYKKLIADDNFTSCLYGYIREDTSLRTVYFQDVLDSAEVVLYDFSMLPGDSIYIHFVPNIWGNYFSNGYYMLDSIAPVNILSGTRKAFYLHCSAGHSMFWIEGIGNTGDLVYPYSANEVGYYFQMGCGSQFPYDFIQMLVCFEHQQKIYFDTCTYYYAVFDFCFNLQDSCNYWNICTVVDDLSNSDAIRIFPNPVSETLTVSGYSPVLLTNGAAGLTDTAIKIFIYNLLGEMVMTTKFTGKINLNTEVNVSQVRTGIYFIQLELNDKVYRMKFMKE
jgi:hypothetical protein